MNVCSTKYVLHFKRYLISLLAYFFECMNITEIIQNQKNELFDQLVFVPQLHLEEYDLT